MVRMGLVVLASLVAASCGDNSSDEPQASAAAAPTSVVATSVGGDTTQESAVAEVSSETFQSVGDTSTCTEDCSGHDAGFEWAKAHDVTEASGCSGNSQSFIEGCETYAQAVEDKADERDDDAESEETE